MSHYWMGRSLLAGILCIAIPQAVAHDLPAALAACREEKDDAQRLACYDREVARAGGQSAESSAAASQAATASAAPPQSPEERFGYRGVLAREEQERVKSATLGQLEATVTDISKRGDGALIMTLDNGQVWAQNRPDAFFRLKVGDSVKIEPAALGSFLMIGPSKRTARVTRQK
jgi:uncharacterized membrane protein